jgi:hypothetical protein
VDGDGLQFMTEGVANQVLQTADAGSNAVHIAAQLLHQSEHFHRHVYSVAGLIAWLLRGIFRYQVSRALIC